MGKLPLIEVGFQVFLGDGADAFGAVRDVAPRGQPAIVVHIEGHGEAVLPLDVVEKVAGQRVVVRWDGLPPDVQRAVRHSLDKEDFPPRDEGEVELMPASEESEDEDPRTLYEGPRVDSPPDELPGRDAGARYAAPPSVDHVEGEVKNRTGGK